MAARGFTLLEVLVAVAVLALALGAAVKAVGVGARDLDHVRERTYGTWVAVDTLTRLQLGLDSATSGSETMAGRDYLWSARLERTADEDVQRVVVEVRPGEGAGAAATVLTGYLPVERQ